jgi:hypothetical protein
VFDVPVLVGNLNDSHCGVVVVVLKCCLCGCLLLLELLQWLDVESLYRVSRGFGFFTRSVECCGDVALTQECLFGRCNADEFQRVDVGATSRRTRKSAVQRRHGCLRCWASAPCGSNTRATKGKRCDMRTNIDGAVLV